MDRKQQPIACVLTRLQRSVVRDSLVGGGVDDTLLDRAPREGTGRTGGRLRTNVVACADLPRGAVVLRAHCAAADCEGPASFQPAVGGGGRLAGVEGERVAVGLVAAHLLTLQGRGIGAVEEVRRAWEV